jgi:hypothetical protein
MIAPAIAWIGLFRNSLRWIDSASARHAPDSHFESREAQKT